MRYGIFGGVTANFFKVVEELRPKVDRIIINGAFYYDEPTAVYQNQFIKAVDYLSTTPTIIIPGPADKRAPFRRIMEYAHNKSKGEIQNTLSMEYLREDDHTLVFLNGTARYTESELISPSISREFIQGVKHDSGTYYLTKDLRMIRELEADNLLSVIQFQNLHLLEKYQDQSPLLITPTPPRFSPDEMEESIDEDIKLALELRNPSDEQFINTLFYALQGQFIDKDSRMKLRTLGSQVYDIARSLSIPFKRNDLVIRRGSELLREIIDLYDITKVVSSQFPFSTHRATTKDTHLEEGIPSHILYVNSGNAGAGNAVIITTHEDNKISYEKVKL
ncbi:MAG: hypothetical protein KC535_02810 [Nanoarchaeota archaeon]|nr:hypothetical protein [Nanoarchaeota archaeon]